MHSHSLLQGIFSTQESNSSLLHCRWILYHLSPQGTPELSKWLLISCFASVGPRFKSLDLTFPIINLNIIIWLLTLPLFFSNLSYFWRNNMHSIVVSQIVTDIILFEMTRCASTWYRNMRYNYPSLSKSVWFLCWNNDDSCRNLRECGIPFYLNSFICVLW